MRGGFGQPGKAVDATEAYCNEKSKDTCTYDPLVNPVSGVEDSLSGIKGGGLLSGVKLFWEGTIPFMTIAPITTKLTTISSAQNTLDNSLHPWGQSVINVAHQPPE